MTAFVMPWDRLDDVDRLMLARDLAVAAGTWPVLAGLAAAVLDCSGRDVLTYEIGTDGSDLAEVGAALEALYEQVRADDAAVRPVVLRLVALWQSFAAHNR